MCKDTSGLLSFCASFMTTSQYKICISSVFGDVIMRIITGVHTSLYYHLFIRCYMIDRNKAMTFFPATFPF